MNRETSRKLMYTYVRATVGSTVGDFQLGEVNHMLHPMSTERRALGMYVDPVFHNWLRFRLASLSPASGIAAIPVLVKHRASAVFVTLLGSRLYLRNDIVVQILLQTANVQLQVRVHASVSKRKDLLEKSLLSFSTLLFFFSISRILLQEKKRQRVDENTIASPKKNIVFHRNFF